MRVLILSQYYDPEPVPKAGELARELAARGHDVQVVTGFPNYPSGRLYDGHRLGLLRKETLDGIPIRRTYEYPYHGTGMGGRILNYASFMISAVVGSLGLRPIDAIYVWHPPLTVGVAAWLVSRLRRTPFVYDVQDIWPETAILSGLMRPGFLVNVMKRIERFVYRRAAHLFVVTEGARQNLIAKGVPADRVTVMPHWIDEKEFAPVDQEEREKVRSAFGWGPDFVVMFAGNIGLVQGLDAVVDAAAKIPHDSRLRLVIVGDGADKARLERLAAALKTGQRLQFVNRQPSSRMPALMAASDALLVHLRRSELSRFVIPTKTLAYLAAGRPIVMAMEGAAADLVGAAGAGVLVAPEQPDELVRALVALEAMPMSDRSEYGRRGREYLMQNLRKSDVITLYERQLERHRKHVPVDDRA
jgi:colanic acid biosynthesis glycosyl transferase WcaI